MDDIGLGIEVVDVPAGQFWMGTNRARLEQAGLLWCDRFECEMPFHEVFLPEYRIAKHPVTNEQYVAFIEDGGYEEPTFWTEAG